MMIDKVEMVQVFFLNQAQLLLVISVSLAVIADERFAEFSL